MDFPQIIALIISTVSVLFGIFSVFTAIRTRKALNKQFSNISESFISTNEKLNSTTSNINSLCHILETKKLGTFPDNMDEINVLIETAISKIEIFVDYFAYGFYSHPKVFAKYLEILQKKISSANNSENPFSINIYCYSDDLIYQTNKVIFNGKSWDEIKGSSRFKNYYNYYKSGNFNNPDSLLKEIDSLKSKEDFFQYLISQNNKYIKWLFPELKEGLPQSKDVNLKRSKTEFPCFLWVKDDEEIILSFSGYRANTGRCIQTKDKELLDLVRNELNSTFRYE